MTDASDLFLGEWVRSLDERYRLSVAFQVRPVAITTSAEPHAALLVGIDYTTSPETIIGKDGIGIDVLPSLGPRLASVAPDRFENGERIEIRGADLHGDDIEIVLDDAVLTIVERRPDRIVATKVAAGKVTRSRPLCAYPLHATYKGSGSIDDEQSFSCAK